MKPRIIAPQELRLRASTNFSITTQDDILFPKVAAKHAEIKPTPEVISLLKNQSHIQDISQSPLITTQIGWLGGLSNTLQQLDWNTYLNHRLGQWVKIVQDEYEREESKRVGGRLQKETYNPLRAEWFKEETDRRLEVSGQFRKLFPSPNVLVQETIKALMKAKSEHRIFSFEPPPSLLPYIINIVPEGDLTQYIVAFEDETGIYFFKGLPEYLSKRDQSEGDFTDSRVRASIGNAGLESYLISQGIDRELSHIIADDFERFILGSQFNPVKPDEFDKLESKYEKAIIDFIKENHTQVGLPVLDTAQDTQRPLDLPLSDDPVNYFKDHSVIQESITVEPTIIEPFIPASLGLTTVFSTGSALQTEDFIPQIDETILQRVSGEDSADGSTALDKTVPIAERLPNLEQIDPTADLFIKTLKTKGVITPNQEIVLILTAVNEELAELAYRRDFQAFENRLASYPNLETKNLTGAIRGICFSQDCYVSNATCLQLSSFLRDASRKDSGYFGFNIDGYLDSKFPHRVIPKICDSSLPPPHTTTQDFRNIVLLVNSAKEKGVIDEKEYDSINILLGTMQTTSSAPIPSYEEMDTIAKKLELHYTDLFSRINNYLSTSTVYEYALDLTKRQVPEPKEGLKNLAKAVELKPIILQAFLYTESILPEPPVIEIPAPQPAEEPSVTTSEILQPAFDRILREKQINEHIVLFFTLSNSFSSYEDFQAALLEELKKKFEISSLDEVSTNLKDLRIDPFSFALYKAYNEERDAGRKITLDSLQEALLKYYPPASTLTRIEINDRTNYLNNRLGLNLLVQKPVWNPVANEKDLELPSLLSTIPAGSRIYQTAAAYLSHIEERGMPPTRAELIKELSIDESTLNDCINRVNSFLEANAYAPLLVFNVARNPVRKIFGAYKSLASANQEINFQNIFKELEPHFGNKEQLAVSLTTTKNEAGFNEAKAFDLDFDRVLANLQSEARDYFASITVQPPTEDVGMETVATYTTPEAVDLIPAPKLLTKDEITRATEELQSSLFIPDFAREWASQSITPEQFHQTLEQTVGGTALYEAARGYLGLSKRDIEVAWAFWRNRDAQANLAKLSIIRDDLEQNGIRFTKVEILTSLDELNLRRGKETFLTEVSKPLSVRQDKQLLEEYEYCCQFTGESYNDHFLPNLFKKLRINGNTSRDLQENIALRLNRLGLTDVEWHIIRVYKELSKKGREAGIADLYHYLRDKHQINLNSSDIHRRIRHINKLFPNNQIQLSTTTDKNLKSIEPPAIYIEAITTVDLYKRLGYDHKIAWEEIQTQFGHGHNPSEVQDAYETFESNRIPVRASYNNSLIQIEYMSRGQYERYYDAFITAQSLQSREPRYLAVVD